MSQDWRSRAEAAERTVEVLARKVMALYRGEPASTIERQLERAQKRQERLLQRRQLTELRAIELARYSAGLEVEVADRTRDLRAILDHVTSALLVVGEDLVVRPGHSSSCHELLGADVVAGRSLLELLGIEDGRRRVEVRLAIEQVFADMLPDEVAVDMIPKRFAVGGRSLNVDARVVRRDGAIGGVLLTINDVSLLEHAEHEARENRTLLRILHGRDSFREFLIDARELLLAASDAVPDDHQVFVRRALHTVKGNAATFDLDEVVRVIHEVESRERVSESDVALVDQTLRSFVSSHRSILDLDYGAANDEGYDVAASTMEELRALAAPSDAVRVAVERWSARVALKRADVMLAPLGAYVGKLAERLEKLVDFRLEGGEIMVDTRAVRPVFQSLTHVLRNAIDHGVEPPDERGGKPPCASVVVTVGETRERWTISVRDDGRGIERSAVVQQAIARGILSPERAAQLEPADVLDLVFADGLSTAGCTTDVSGRGVGLSALRGAVRESGGSVKVDSSPGVHTTIELWVPKPDALRPASSATAA